MEREEEIIMKKRVLLAGLSIAVCLSMTACGSSKEDTPKASDTERETVQQTEDDFSEDEMAGSDDQEVYYSAEEVCAMYYDYLTGGLTEEELAEELEAITQGVTVERAKEIFEESGELYGFSEPVVCEPTSEILNASAGDQVLQVGDVVIQFPCTFGDFMEAVNGEFGDKDEAGNADRAMAYIRREYSLDATFQTLDTLGAHGDALVKSSDGSFLMLYLGDNDDKEIQTAKDLYVTRVQTGSPNVFFAGGIHTGLTMQEVDEIIEKSANEFSNNDWSTSSHGYLYRNGNINNKVAFHLYLDPEENQLWMAQFSFEAPSSEE